MDEHSPDHSQSAQSKKLVLVGGQEPASAKGKIRDLFKGHRSMESASDNSRVDVKNARTTAKNRVRSNRKKTTLREDDLYCHDWLEVTSSGQADQYDLFYGS